MDSRRLVVAVLLCVALPSARADALGVRIDFRAPAAAGGDRSGPEEHGALMVAACDRASELPWKDVCAARAHFTAIALMLGFDPAAPAVPMAGLVPRHDRIAGGLESEYIPVFLVGHGPILYPMAVVTSADSRYGIAVQLQADNLCGPNERSPFCSDPKGRLTELAAGIARRIRAR